jgi:hypothetical protein
VTEVNPLLPEADVSGLIYFKNNYVGVSFNGLGMFSSDGTHWTQSNITASTNNLYDVAGNTTEAIAVGTGGATFVSSNGKTWTPGQVVGSNTLVGITWTGNEWIVVGYNGELDTSPDGVTWTNQPAGAVGAILYAVTYTGFSYVTVGQAGIISTSTDSKSWVTHNSPNLTQAGNLTGVAYNPTPGQQDLVAVSDTGLVFTSIDQGDTWNQVVGAPVGTGTGDWQRVHWFPNPGIFVAVGLGETIMTSPDGFNWTLSTVNKIPPAPLVTYELFDVAANPTGTHAVASGANTLIFNTSDFDTWNQKYEGIYPNLYGFFFLGNFTSVATDDQLSIVEVGTDPDANSDSIVAFSTDGGASFAASVTVPVNTLDSETFNPNGVAYSPTLAEYAAVGRNNSVELSTDGGFSWLISWTYNRKKHEEPSFNGITWAGNQFVAVGIYGNYTDGGNSDVSLGPIQESPDGTNWFKVDGVSIQSMYGVGANGNGRVAAVGANGEVAVTSDINDGTNSQWSGQELSSLPQLNSVAYGNGLWVAVGVGGAAFTAPDVTNADGTLTWSVNGIGGEKSNLNGVFYSNGLFYVCSADGLLFMSADTLSWLPCVEPDPNGLINGATTTFGTAVLSAQGNTYVGVPPSPPIPGIIITKQPKDTAAVLGKAFSLSALGKSVDPSNSSITYPVFYQWEQNGTELTNGGNVINSNEATLTINPTKSTSAGNYTVLISNGLKTVLSHIAHVTVNFPPKVTTQPVSQHVLVASQLILTVQATGTPVLKYQWLWNGKPLVNNSVVKGANSATLQILFTQPRRSGSYQCKITSPYGTVLSNIANIKMG